MRRLSPAALALGCSIVFAQNATVLHGGSRGFGAGRAGVQSRGHAQRWVKAVSAVNSIYAGFSRGMIVSG